MEKIEKLVADAILENESDILVINGKEYPIAPPTPATLIHVSALVSTLPELSVDADNLLLEILGKAKDLSVIGEICAVLILGAKRIKEQRQIEIVRHSARKRWSWKKFRFTSEYKKKVTELEYLSELILDNVSNKTLFNIVSKRLGMMQISDFFGLTTSLCAANQLRKTKEVEATVSGD